MSTPYQKHLVRPAALPEIFDHILLGYNEQDLGKIRDHLFQAVTPDIYFVDDIFEDHDFDGFVNSMKLFRTRMPKAIYQITSEIDVKHDRLFRYLWRLSDDTHQINGMDIYQLNKDGKICRIDSWFGERPGDFTKADLMKFMAG